MMRLLLNFIEVLMLEKAIEWTVLLTYITEAMFPGAGDRFCIFSEQKA